MSGSVTPQEQDPAWKHCLMFKIGHLVELKCVYCGKNFNVDGIHRIKEHLAGQKGNVATCSRVQPDVQLQMLESLNGIAVNKIKKENLAEEILCYDDLGKNYSGMNTEIHLLPVHDALEDDTDDDVYGNTEVEVSKKDDIMKNGRVRKPLDNSNDVSHTVCMGVGRFFLDVGLSMNAVNSDYFQPMIDAIASQGEGAIGPSYHDLRSWILKNLVHEVRKDFDQCSVSWGRTGCTLLVNEWNSRKGKTFVNFFVYCPECTTFLRSADISNVIDPSNAIYKLMRETVDKVGLKNVVQVITSSEDRYVIAGKRLTDTYPSVSWTPCAAHCIDLMLEDIGKLPKVKKILDQAKSISRYIYNNISVLNMMRQYTFGFDLVDLGVTRSSTDSTTLKRMVNIQHGLHSMFTSEDWKESPYSKKPEGIAVLEYITNLLFWSECASVTRLIDPLLRLSRIVGSEKRPAMGFVFAGIYRAKETIMKELVAKEEYLVYWKIIDCRWEQLQWHPLHAAGFYFNPRFYYRIQGDVHLQIRSLVYDCIEEMVTDNNIQDKIMKEIASYHSCVGDFGRNMAIRARDTLLPTEWWQAYGGGCPNLTRFAIRVLSQTCSLIKLNKITFEQMHERKNCLEQQRLNDLVLVQYNMSLNQMAPYDKQQENIDPISYENIDIVQDWVMDKDTCSNGSGNADWMAVDPPLGDAMLLGQSVDDIEALGDSMTMKNLWNERL
ncbi:hypothetical protein ACJIZ3_002893 [Penstemon smallii]|uniref:BED-type domain-containing protein n=1 Tax=Penstemon smallii TaxID=265156 RepID=A0ABD3U929_9LAMI